MSMTTSTQRQFPCRNCGAVLEFAPGVSCLKCPYCQTENQIEAENQPVRELDFVAALTDRSAAENTRDVLTVKCAACGAESILKADVTADKCPFCGAAIVAQAASTKLIQPWGLLPFKITREQAMASFRAWVGSLWFAPSDLARYADANAVRGLYIPYWTYDCETESDYRGERGDDYHETQHYTVTVNGRTEHRTRTVTRTRWRSVSGRVSNSFDDVLVLASNSLPRSYTEKLEPWDLENLVPYRDEYLAGFVAESYQIDLESGFGIARQIMDQTIRSTIRRDIGGDHQRIHWVNTRYDDILFKHILLPLWLSAYRYRDRSFRFLINARTGEVCGERPYSVWKITLLVLTILVVIGIIVFFISQR